MMQDNYTPKGKHLTELEHQLIEPWKNKERFSNREIAYRLVKAPQPINNELKRGMIQLKTKRKNSKRPTKLTPKLDNLIYRAVKEKIFLEVIHQKIKAVVCLRTLYRLPLWQSIEERPESINARSEYGHWEIDTVLLTKEKGECLLTLTERKTRLEIIRLITDKTIQSVNHALRGKDFSALSGTADNGKEFTKLSEDLDCSVYYCHAYASHERGTNENHNRMIRRRLPKGTKKTMK